MRQTNALSSTRSRGYHLNGTVTSAASCPRSFSSSRQPLGEHLCAAARERHLRMGDDDPHRRAWIA